MYQMCTTLMFRSREPLPEVHAPQRGNIEIFGLVFRILANAVFNLRRAETFEKDAVVVLRRATCDCTFETFKEFFYVLRLFCSEGDVRVRAFEGGIFLKQLTFSRELFFESVVIEFVIIIRICVVVDAGSSVV